jgi:hypothetical protein
LSFFLQATATNRTDNRTMKKPDINRRIIGHPF